MKNIRIKWQKVYNKIDKRFEYFGHEKKDRLRWKIYHFFDNKKWMLYDLAFDTLTATTGGIAEFKKVVTAKKVASLISNE